MQSEVSLPCLRSTNTPSLCKMPSSVVWRRVDVLQTAATCSRWFPALGFFSTLKMEAIRSSETSAHTRCTPRHITEYGILHSHRCENLRSAVCSHLLTLVPRSPIYLYWRWYRRSPVTSVHTRSKRRHIPEDGILHSHRCENLKSAVCSHLLTLVPRSRIYLPWRWCRRSPEPSVHTSSKRRHIPKDGILHSHRCENLKSYALSLLCGDVRFSAQPLRLRINIYQLSGTIFSTHS
jgi:hypothetical protein